MAEEHQWVVLAVYELTLEDIEKGRSKERVPLSGDKLVGVEGPGCFRCGNPWDAVKDKPCKGGNRLVKEGFSWSEAEGGVNIDRHRRE